MKTMPNPIDIDTKHCLMIFFISFLEVIRLFLDLLKFLDDLISSQIHTNFNFIKFQDVF